MTMSPTVTPTRARRRPGPSRERGTMGCWLSKSIAWASSPASSSTSATMTTPSPFRRFRAGFETTPGLVTKPKTLSMTPKTEATKETTTTEDGASRWSPLRRRAKTKPRPLPVGEELTYKCRKNERETRATESYARTVTIRGCEDCVLVFPCVTGDVTVMDCKRTTVVIGPSMGKVRVMDCLQTEIACAATCDFDMSDCYDCRAFINAPRGQSTVAARSCGPKTKFAVCDVAYDDLENQLAATDYLGGRWRSADGADVELWTGVDDEAFTSTFDATLSCYDTVGDAVNTNSENEGEVAVRLYPSAV